MSRRFLMRFHLWLGLVASVPLLAIVTTGLILGLSRLPVLAGPPPEIDVAHALETIARAHSGVPLETVSFPESRWDALRVRWRDGTRKTYDATTLAESGSAQDPRRFRESLYRIHRGKLLGLPGQIVASGSAVAVLVLWLAGLRLRRSAEGGGRAEPGYRLHRRLGTLFGIVLCAITAGGALLNFVGELSSRFDPVPAVHDAAEPKAVDLARAIAVARASLPGAQLESAHAPRRRGDPVLVVFAEGSRVFLEPGTLEVLKVSSWRSHWTRALFPLHTGRVLGRGQPVWIAFAGALALTLILAGLRMAPRRIGS